MSKTRWTERCPECGGTGHSSKALGDCSICHVCGGQPPPSPPSRVDELEIACTRTLHDAVQHTKDAGDCWISTPEKAIFALAHHARELEMRVERLSVEIEQAQEAMERFDLRNHKFTVAGAVISLGERANELEKKLEDARSYVAEVAQGISHYPHADGEPCVRCGLEEAEESIRALGRSHDARREERDEARDELARLRKIAVFTAVDDAGFEQPLCYCAVCLTLRQGGGGE